MLIFCRTWHTFIKIASATHTISMKSKSPTTKKSKQNFEKDYKKMMKDFIPSYQLGSAPQWPSTGNYFQKFSLYPEFPNSVASTGTMALTNC